MTTSADIDHALDEGDFDALEALLVSEAVPADCMNLEMLDGYLAAIACAPLPIPPERWMPGVWSADEDSMSFASGSSMQQAIALVLRYHNEVVTTLLAEEGWEPFCYAPDEADDDAPPIGDEWAGGFDQGLECWPEEWAEGLTEEQAEAIRARLETIMAPWEAEEAGVADDETRIGWLRDAADGVRAVAAQWIALGRTGAAPVEVGAGVAGRAGPGRNDPCTCGSGKKYKHCCGAAS
jgi:uncharacterized protein